jgi:hypothetical protein
MQGAAPRAYPDPSVKKEIAHRLAAEMDTQSNVPSFQRNESIERRRLVACRAAGVSFGCTTTDLSRSVCQSHNREEGNRASLRGREGRDQEEGMIAEGSLASPQPASGH